MFHVAPEPLDASSMLEDEPPLAAADQHPNL
jgi:hypothetical protein